MADDLLSMFATMGTSDHNTLVEQFQQIVPDAGPEEAQFFLEANNWSLQPAIMSYFDNGGQTFNRRPQCNPQAELVCDVTIAEGEEVPPHVRFQKTWRLRNTGAEQWPPSTVLNYCQGDVMHAPQFVKVPPLLPGEMCDVSVNLVSPPQVGQYASSWRLAHNEGMHTMFGDEIWVLITVADGTLPLAQQFAATSFS